MAQNTRAETKPGKINKRKKVTLVYHPPRERSYTQGQRLKIGAMTLTHFDSRIPVKWAPEISLHSLYSVLEESAGT